MIGYTKGILAESSLTYTTAKTIYDMTAINVNDEITQSALLQTEFRCYRNNTIYDMYDKYHIRRRNY